MSYIPPLITTKRTTLTLPVKQTEISNDTKKKARKYVPVKNYDLICDLVCLQVEVEKNKLTEKAPIKINLHKCLLIQLIRLFLSNFIQTREYTS